MFRHPVSRPVMKQTRLLTTLVAALLCAVAASGQEPEPQKYVLREAGVGVGDVCVHVTRGTMTMQMKAFAPGSEEPVFDSPYTSNTLEKYTETVLAASKGA